MRIYSCVLYLHKMHLVNVAFPESHSALSSCFKFQSVTDFQNAGFQLRRF